MAIRLHIDFPRRPGAGYEPEPVAVGLRVTARGAGLPHKQHKAGSTPAPATSLAGEPAGRQLLGGARLGSRAGRHGPHQPVVFRRGIESASSPHPLGPLFDTTNSSLPRWDSF